MTPCYHGCTCVQGALLCLAAAAVGIGRPNAAQLHEVVPVVLVKMTDQDTDVR